MTLKSLTLSDLKVPFYTKFVFIIRLAKFFCIAFGVNCVKMYEDISTLSLTEMFTKDSSFE